MDTGLTTEYFILNLFCAIVFIFYGKVIASAKTNYQYYLRASFPIITYALVHGLRFGRAIDWNVYYHIYTEIGKGVSSKHYEPIFSLLCRSLYELGTPYCLFIIIQCAFLMTTIFILIKNYKKYIPFILPLILPVVSANDNLIRWFWGFGFILLSINSVIKEKRLWVCIWALCAVGFHIGYMFFLPFIIFYQFFNKLIFPPILAIVLLYLTSFFVGISSMTAITWATEFLLRMGVGEIDTKVEYYLLGAQDLINGDFGHVGYMDRSLRSLIRLCFIYTPVLWFATMYVDKIKYGRFLYNMFAIGVIVYPLFCVEILDRYAKCLVFFSCVVCGVFFYEALKEKAKWHMFMNVVVWLCFFLATWPSISASWTYGDVPMCGNNQMFIWDAKGRKSMF